MHNNGGLYVHECNSAIPGRRTADCACHGEERGREKEGDEQALRNEGKKVTIVL